MDGNITKSHGDYRLFGNWTIFGREDECIITHRCSHTHTHTNIILYVRNSRFNSRK